MSIDEIIPYQPDDWVREADPITGEQVFTEHKGPIYELHYPAGLNTNHAEEMIAWYKLGYITPAAFSNDMSKGFTLTLKGDIPEWLLDRLRGYQVRIELQKERGPAVPIVPQQKIFREIK